MRYDPPASSYVWISDLKLDNKSRVLIFKIYSQQLNARDLKIFIFQVFYIQFIIFKIYLKLQFILICHGNIFWFFFFCHGTLFCFYFVTAAYFVFNLFVHLVRINCNCIKGIYLRVFFFLFFFLHICIIVSLKCYYIVDNIYRGHHFRFIKNSDFLWCLDKLPHAMREVYLAELDNKQTYAGTFSLRWS